MQQYSPYIKVMLDATRKASRGLARDFGEVENLQVSKKGPKDFVSSADMKAEKTIIYELQKARPEYSILSEEAGAMKGTDADHCWITDPLDGTMNFLHGVSLFCTTIALQKTINGKKEIIAAVVESPITKEIFWAEKGKGAWLETGEVSAGIRLRVGARTRLPESLLGVGSVQKDVPAIGALVGQVQGVRCLGSTVLGLAYVAAGRLDGFVHSSCYPWDMAAGILLVREAGGYVSDIKGKDAMFETQTIVATNADLQPLILREMKKLAA